MSDDKQREMPYQTLGSRLRRLRERLQQSVVEVSGAVEIEAETLEQFEQGRHRPSEDILQLLISYFDMKDEEATKLWKLAGYEQPSLDENGDEQNAPSVVVMPFDVRIAYTDMSHISANQYGITMNFMQTAGPNSQPLIVSRLGMSREHAQNVLEQLQKVLEQIQPKALPAPEKPIQKQEKTDQ